MGVMSSVAALPGLVLPSAASPTAGLPPSVPISIIIAVPLLCSTNERTPRAGYEIRCDAASAFFAPPSSVKKKGKHAHEHTQLTTGCTLPSRSIPSSKPCCEASCSVRVGSDGVSQGTQTRRTGMMLERGAFVWKQGRQQNRKLKGEHPDPEAFVPVSFFLFPHYGD